MEWRMLQRRPLAGKLVAIGLIVLGLMIPLSMLRGLIEERSQMRAQAVETVGNGWGSSLTAGGPMLRVPFDVATPSKTGESAVEHHQLYAFADELGVHASLEQISTRRVGIYGVPVYLVRVKLTGQFKMTDVLKATAARAPAAFHWSEARLRLPLSDVRSIREFGIASFAGSKLEFGPALANGFPGVEAAFDLSREAKDGLLPFTIEMLLAGSQSLAVLPTAAKTEVQLSADWPDPQFQGAFLPSRYSIGQHGFTAEWQVLALNRTFAQTWADNEVDAPTLRGSGFGFGLFQSVDVYQRSERAVKYALLFIALTFLSFFAWESLGRIRVHAVHYAFIGLALSTFYLLLIALAEHLPFWLSFWSGAAALVALLGHYVSGALQSAHAGIGVACVMSLVYALLFMLVLSESYSLLIGAIALFGFLATVMIATRRLHWDSHGATG